MSKHLCILISPTGDEAYDTYGPTTKLRDRATRYDTAAMAMGAANQRYGRHGAAFWNSERASQQAALSEHRDWTVRTEEVADDDARREGHYVMDYPSEGKGDRLYAHGDPAKAQTWSSELQDCHLWTTRDEALMAIRSMPARAGRRYAIDTY